MRKTLVVAAKQDIGDLVEKLSGINGLQLTECHDYQQAISMLPEKDFGLVVVRAAIERWPPDQNWPSSYYQYPVVAIQHHCGQLIARLTLNYDVPFIVVTDCNNDREKVRDLMPYRLSPILLDALLESVRSVLKPSS